MIRVRSLISSLKSSLLTNRNAFPHKAEDQWDREFKQQNPKMNHLQKLLQQNEIRPYFIEKDISELSKQDIYFYMENKSLFHKIPKQKKQELIKNSNLGCVQKFHLALELHQLRNQQIQEHLLHSFNSTIQSLKITDVVFCLQLICGFENVKEDINYYELEKKFLNEEDSAIFIRFIYILSRLEFSLQQISKEFIQEKITMLEKLDLQTIYHIKTIAKFYQIQLTHLTQNRLRTSFMEERKEFKEEDSEFIVQLLQYYPSSANFLNLQCLSIQSYASYLQFFMSEGEQLSKETMVIPKPIHHPIPHSILIKAEVHSLFKIVKHRVTLGLETPESIVNTIKDQFTKNLNYVVSVIRYLVKEQKVTPQLEAILEKSIHNKLIKHGDKVFDEFKIFEVFKVLGYLSINQLGTINFWKKALAFVSKAISDPHTYKNLSSDQQKKFVFYVFQIYKNKPFPRELQDQIINLTLLSLTINKWSLKEILPLIVSLTANKIADNQLWYGIQQRVKKTNLRHLDYNEDRRALLKIAYNFNMIGKGSYQFWSEINDCLRKKEKTDLLNMFKIPSTMAHIYLKL